VKNTNVSQCPLPCPVQGSLCQEKPHVSRHHEENYSIKEGSCKECKKEDEMDFKREREAEEMEAEKARIEGGEEKKSKKQNRRTSSGSLITMTRHMASAQSHSVLGKYSRSRDDEMAAYVQQKRQLQEHCLTAACVCQYLLGKPPQLPLNSMRDR